MGRSRGPSVEEQVFWGGEEDLATGTDRVGGRLLSTPPPTFDFPLLPKYSLANGLGMRAYSEAAQRSLRRCSSSSLAGGVKDDFPMALLGNNTPRRVRRIVGNWLGSSTWPAIAWERSLLKMKLK